jgi:hypothetical protein
MLRPIFWIIMGLIYAISAAGAKIWAEDLGIEMNWWKWLFSITWYCALSISFAAGFTLMGEKEKKAGFRFLGISLTGTMIMGLVLVYLLFAF